MSIKTYHQDKSQFEGSIGLKFPLNGKLNKTFFNVSKTTEEQAITNYINLLLTRKGERYYHPNYGIGIQLFLFEPNTDQNRREIEFEIRNQCNFWLPYIVNHRIDVRGNSDLPGLNSDPETAIHIVITFSVGEQNANKTITLFQRGGIVTANVE